MYIYIYIFVYIYIYTYLYIFIYIHKEKTLTAQTFCRCFIGTLMKLRRSRKSWNCFLRIYFLFQIEFSKAMEFLISYIYTTNKYKRLIRQQTIWVCQVNSLEADIEADHLHVIRIDNLHLSIDVKSCLQSYQINKVSFRLDHVLRKVCGQFIEQFRPFSVCM